MRTLFKDGLIGGWIERTRPPSVPDINSADNNYFGDVIGNKEDTWRGSSLVSILRKVEERLNTAAKCYPTLADGVVLTTAGGAWTLGALVEIVPADTITSEFLIYYVYIETVSKTDVYEVVLYDTAEAEIGRLRTSRDTLYPQAGGLAISTTVIPANTKISAKLANKTGGGETMTVSLHYIEIV